MLEAATEPMLQARLSLRQELAGLERHVRQLSQEDPACRRMMSMPGVGPVVALSYRSAIDDPGRFTFSKKVGPWVGLTPSRDQSGEREVSGGITKAGDVNLRRALWQAATVMMHRGRSTWLRTWAARVARRRGSKRAMVALARRISVILHHVGRGYRLPFRWSRTEFGRRRRATNRRLPDRRPSRFPRDEVTMMPSSRLLPRNWEHTNEMAHRNCIEPASCWRPTR